MKRYKRMQAAVAGALLVFAGVACGSDSTSAPIVSDVTTSGVGSGDDVNLPARIVSLSPTHTEILFAIGAGDRVVAVDAMSNHPPEAAGLVTALSGFEPNVESIVSYEPDLVVIGDDYNGLADQLSAVGIESWAQPAPQNIDEVLAQIEDLGRRTGNFDSAVQLSADMRADIESIVAGTTSATDALTYYHELDDTNYSITSNTFIGSVYGLFGLRNIADAAEANSDYPQLSAEFIVSQNPDLIFLADTKCCAVSVESVASRPGWSSIDAVVNGHVIALDDDIASRWGPRIVDFVRAISEAIAAVNRTAG